MVSYKICVCFTRSFGTANLQPPTDVVDAFKKYTAGSAGSLTRGRYMNAEELRRFLVEEQGLTTTTTIDDAERVIEEVLKRRHHHHHLHHMGKFTRRNELSLDDFLSFLFSVELNPPITSQIHQDMTAPLSHYFIYTGHNSYLTGNQLSSDCSDVPIITALTRGVRVIELDLWPNSTKDDVHVLHGRTLTRPVTLVKCLKSIKDHAFAASPYPVILTLEDHLTPVLQAKVAQMLTETFEEMLFYPESESDTCTEFPSPEELKYKVIISTKPPNEYLTSKSLMDDKGITDHTQKRKDLDLGHVSDKALSAPEYEVIADQGCDRKVEGEGSEPDQAADYGEDKQDTRGPPVYKRLITIPAKRRGKGLDESLKMDPNQVARLSLSEQALEKASISHHATDVVRFTQRNILRIFPKTTRFDSSNYNPLVGWMHGAQMVAFNMQGFGKWLWLMHGMFKANGGCGYVKKPDFIMKFDPDNNQVFNPKSNLNVKKTLKVKVYMGEGWQSDFKRTHFDSYSPPDFYVKVGIAGVRADEVRKKTKIKEDQWNPVWEEEFTFPLTVPELALLRIQVLEYDISEKDDFGGQTCLPVSELKPGIHALPLYDYKGEKYPSVKLLMTFQFT